MSTHTRVPATAALLALLAACSAAIPKDALRLPEEAAADREAQTRRYDGIGERKLLAAGASVLQDLGFEIDESETRLGVIVASKERTAVNKKEVTAAVILSVLSAFTTAPTEPTYAQKQVVRVSLVTSPAREVAAGGDATLLRVTFQRSVFDNHDHL